MADSDDDSLIRAIARAPDREPETTPEKLAQFRIVERIGKGGMGVVYRAVDEKLGREVALKVLPGAFERDEERRRRFLREARAAAAVTHPNLITVHEIDEAEGRIFIAMELVPGESLRDSLARGAPSVTEALRRFREICRGVAKAHERGIVHRDLKPDNVMLTADGGVKVLDFGLAKQRAADLEHADTQTDEGRIVGTPDYMSPEQAAGRAVDARADVFSLGVILYELCAGRRPFRGSSAMEVLVSVARDPPPPLPTISGELQALIGRCLEKDPAKRFADAGALALAIEALPATPTARRKLPLVAAAAILAVAGGAILIATRPERSRAPATAPAPARHGIGLLDLPIPQSPIPEARAAYKAGMQALHDSNYGRANIEFRRCAGLDPNMAMAHFRVAFTAWWTSPVEAMKSYARAVGLRSELDARDRDLVDAYEPRLGRAPPADGEFAAKLRALAARRPDDAEIVSAVSFYDPDPNERLRASQAAIALDPSYADAWQTLARARLQLGKDAEANQAFARCLELAPQAADCRQDLMTLEDARGECAALEEEAGRWLTQGYHVVPPFPPNWLGSTWRASAAFLIGRPVEVVREMIQQTNLSEPAHVAEAWSLVDNARLDVLRGDFAGAEQRARKLAALVGDQPDAGLRSGPAWLLAQLYLEEGRNAEADRVAADYLTRAVAWTPIPSRLVDAVPTLLGVRRRAGGIGAAEHEKQLRAWLAARGGPGGDALDLAQHGWAPLVEEPAEAQLALEELAPFAGKIRTPVHYLTLDRAYVARLPLLAGQPDEGLRQLEVAANSCTALVDPFQYTKVHLWLGQAREQHGDRAGACAAYRVVDGRWGRARRSVTGAQARARIVALGCK
jgi:serine/threonine-protein kinase